MPPRQHGLGIGADLVGDIAGAPQRAVAAHDDEVNFSALHEVARGVVGNDVVRNSLLGQLPSRERRPLRAGPGFITKHMEPPSGRLGGIQGCRGRADVHAREPAGVAVGQHPRAVPDEFAPVPANGPTFRDAAVGEFLRRRQGQRLLFGDTRARREGGPDFRQDVDRIHRRGPRGGEGVEHAVEMPLECPQAAPGKSAGALRQTVGGGCRNGGRPAHHHVANGGGGLPIIAAGHDLERVR
ncbi:MAG: hypothetical protein BWX84_02924 [Verrucomicrobia bacterium ADurb.Bin118]|nr:MAG: hypothetical protein BWX84_02924 [Verrucomicrobia bacterium ADurb.Bin118]